MKNKKHKNIFTPTELLVAIAVISILTVIFLPALKDARESVRRLKCENHLQELAKACILYLEKTGEMPKDLATLHKEYFGCDTEMFSCPSAQYNANDIYDYSIYENNEGTECLIYDKSLHHIDGINCVIIKRNGNFTTAWIQGTETDPSKILKLAHAEIFRKTLPVSRN